MNQNFVNEVTARLQSDFDDNSEWFEVAYRRLVSFDGPIKPELFQSMFSKVMEYFYNRSKFNQALQLGERGIEISQRLGWKPQLRFFHHFTAVLLKSIGDQGRATSHLVAALEIAWEIHDRVAECRAHGQLASTLLMTGQFDGVIKSARTALAIASTCPDSVREIKFQCNQLIAEASLHLMHKADERQQRLAEGLLSITNAVREAGEPTTKFEMVQVNRMRLTQVQLYVRAGQIDDASNAAKQCRVLADASGNPNATLNADIADAMVDGARGNFVDARQSLRRLIADSDLQDDMKGDAIAGLAFVFEHSGDIKGAEQAREDLYQSWQRKHIATAHRIFDQLASQYPPDKTQALNAATMEAVETIALVGEVHDDDTGTHVYRVGAMTALLAKKLGMSDDEATQLDYAARLHDIGKIAIHMDIMQKPGSLSRIERAEMQKHTTIGATILAKIVHPIMSIASQIAGAHHERWDGEGYPVGLSGESIPFCARIATVADVYDALTHARAYKHAWEAEHAIAEIIRGRGTAFDPAVVDAFVQVVQKLIAEFGEDSVDVVLGASSQDNALVSAREFLKKVSLQTVI